MDGDEDRQNEILFAEALRTVFAVYGAKGGKQARLARSMEISTASVSRYLNGQRVMDNTALGLFIDAVAKLDVRLTHQEIKELKKLQQAAWLDRQARSSRIVKQLQEKLAELGEQLARAQSAQRQVEQLTAELAGTQQRVEQLTQDLTMAQGAQRQVVGLREELAAAQRQVQQLAGQLAEAKAENAELVTQVKEKVRQLTAAAAMIRELQEDLEAVREDNRDLVAEVRTLRAQVDTLYEEADGSLQAVTASETLAETFDDLAASLLAREPAAVAARAGATAPASGAGIGKRRPRASEKTTPRTRYGYPGATFSDPEPATSRTTMWVVCLLSLMGTALAISYTVWFSAEAVSKDVRTPTTVSATLTDCKGPSYTDNSYQCTFAWSYNGRRYSVSHELAADKRIDTPYPLKIDATNPGVSEFSSEEPAVEALGCGFIAICLLIWTAIVCYHCYRILRR